MLKRKIHGCFMHENTHFKYYNYLFRMIKIIVKLNLRCQFNYSTLNYMCDITI